MPMKSRPRKRHASSTSAEATSSEVFSKFVEPAPPEPVVPLDPVAVAIQRLLAHALKAASTTVEEAARDGVVTLIVLPSKAWAEAALDHWKTVVRNGAEAEDGLHSKAWRGGQWMHWAPSEALSEHMISRAEERFAEGVAAWRHCAAFTPDLDWLPSDIVRAADHRVNVGPLTPADVGAVAQAVCGGEPTEALSQAEAADLSPRLLRLAHRPQQTADAYIRKLRGLIESERVPVEAVDVVPRSIRDSPTLARLHGMDEALAWGMNFASDLAKCQAGTLEWAALERGLLLSGPPGCGKTLFPRALAATCNVPLISGSYSTWMANGLGHQGDLLNAMRRTFKDARSRAPCVLFIDEVDSFPNRTMVSHHYKEWETQVVNALLAEIDGVEGRDGVVLIAACNHPNLLDPALVRSGRLDRHIRVELPDRAALVRIFREHLCDDLPGDDLRSAALAAVGATGADVERYVRGARRRARNAGRPMKRDDLLAEIVGRDRRTAEDWQVAAVHEAGHAVAIFDLEPDTLIAVTLIGDESRGGGVVGGRNPLYLTAPDIGRRLIVLLAGRAAEEVILKIATSGAGGSDSSDLARATLMTADALASLGLDKKYGLVWKSAGLPADLQRLLSQELALATRVRDIVDEAYADALALMTQRSAAVRKLADVLLERRVIDGDEAAAIIAACPPDPVIGSVP